jgi:hypothetical protein
VTVLAALSVTLLGGCWTDAATRLAYDLEAGADKVGRNDGARYTVVHRTPSRRGECEGPYRVQLDKVGALVVWCKDAAGDSTVSSHSTSHHGRHVRTSRTWIVDKRAGEPLSIDLERQAGSVVIVSVD